MIFDKLSPKQLKSMLWWSLKDTRKHKAIICDGSVRSGKTMSMSIGFILWSMKNFNNETFALCGKTIDSLKRNVIIPLQKWLEGIAEPKINFSKNYMDITLNRHTNRYYFFGGKDESSYQLIQGITLSGVMLDEAALMPRSFVEQAVMRCSVKGSRLWFNCNPESSEHWFYKEWILKADEKNVLHLHFTMSDNLSLAEETRIMYEKSFTGVFYDRYIKGLWVLADGLVYSVFDKNRHILDNYVPSSDAVFYVSCDYGTMNSTSMGLWALEYNRAVRINEYYYSGRDNASLKTDEEYYQALEKLTSGYDIQYVIIDPSAASFIECIRRHGKFSVRKAKNDVLDGIRAASTLISNDKIFICKCCKDIVREFSLYCWDNKAKDDRPLKENDHAMDDMRYFVNNVLSAKLLREVYYKDGDRN